MPAILPVNVVIGVSQEMKAEQAVRSLRTLTAPMATAALQSLVTLVPPLGTLLTLVPSPPPGWMMAFGAALLTPVLCDLLSRFTTDRTPYRSGRGAIAS
ncbi:hypothetical protein AB0F17_60040 [Nonomuraea sp. NPDC026600]|uniref:hypothetical protein n=1 Tax=Nonomuraea sp. NPDC026600 TaxID=3155363 RepID=UPI0033EDF567